MATSGSDEVAAECVRLGAAFFFHTYVRTSKKLRSAAAAAPGNGVPDMQRWLELFERRLLRSTAGSRAASRVLCEYVLTREHTAGTSFLRHYLLECPLGEVRDATARLVRSCLIQMTTTTTTAMTQSERSALAALGQSVCALIDKSAVEWWKHAHELLFVLVRSFVLESEHVATACEAFLATDGLGESLFGKLVAFLIENPTATLARPFDVCVLLYMLFRFNF